MAQATHNPDPTTINLHGEQLLNQIGGRQAALPRRTLFGMAMGGLRVRLARSLVTLISVVLAIAFLCYTGLSNQMVFALAAAVRGGDQARAIEIEQLLRANGINAQLILDEGNPMDTWLIVMALLTCAVGITNAMLMSVTERIREIGTMKCLGAIDNVVVKLFLIESGLVGLIGSLAGILLGVLVAVAAAVLQFGNHGLTYFPWLGGLSIVGWSIVAGLVLAVSGAVYPALIAARMNPVDALRVDE